MRADLVETSSNYLHEENEEKQEFFEQRLDILREQVTIINNNGKNKYIKLDKLLVYIALEYVLNCNPDPILIKNIYENLDQQNKKQSLEMFYVIILMNIKIH